MDIIMLKLPRDLGNVPGQSHERIGKGKFSEVFLGIDVNNIAWAVKIVKSDRASEQMFMNELKALRMLSAANSPHIVRLPPYESSIYAQFSNEAMSLVLELLPNGELFDYASADAFSETLSRTYFIQLLDAITTCHSMGIFHRDIKLENMMVSGEFSMKLIDFGLAFISHIDIDVGGVHKDILIRGSVGTVGNMSPEILANTPYYGRHADVWSAGVVLFNMLMSHAPFNVASRNDWWFRRLQSRDYNEFWSSHQFNGCTVSGEAQDLLNKMFAADPSQRLSIAQIRDHIWLSGQTFPPAQLAHVMTSRSEELVSAARLATTAAHASSSSSHSSSSSSSAAQTAAIASSPGPSHSREPNLPRLNRTKEHLKCSDLHDSTTSADDVEVGVVTPTKKGITSSETYANFQVADIETQSVQDISRAPSMAVTTVTKATTAATDPRLLHAKKSRPE